MTPMPFLCVGRSWVASCALAGLACVAMLLPGCASVTNSPVQEAAHHPGLTLLHDEVFSTPSPTPDTAAVLALSPAMQAYLDAAVRPKVRQGDARRALLKAVFDERDLKLEYDSSFTRNAAEAFEARRGNCLSLVLMTAALARELGIPVRFQEVLVHPQWERQGSVQFLTGHVNLALGPKRLGSNNAVPGLDEASSSLIVDFLPERQIAGYHTRDVAEARVLAMYHNNRSAELLAASQWQDAYAHARQAIRLDPSLWASYNALALIYQSMGHNTLAQAAFEHVLAHDASNIPALGNLAQLMQQTGQPERAAALSERLKALQPEQPFADFDQGLALMRAGRYSEARDAFAREARRAPGQSEFHFWLAMAHFALADYSATQKQLEAALRGSLSNQQRMAYRGKLDALKALQQSQRQPPSALPS